MRHFGKIIFLTNSTPALGRFLFLAINEIIYFFKN